MKRKYITTLLFTFFIVIIFAITPLAGKIINIEKKDKTPQQSQAEAEKEIPLIEIVIGDPKVLAVAPVSEKRWGFYQFPCFLQLKKGDIVANYNVADDSHDGAGESHPSPYIISHNNGKTWESLSNVDEIQFSRILMDGTEIRSEGQEKKLIKDLNIKPVFESYIDHYGNMYDLYLFDDLPQNIKGIKTIIRKPEKKNEEKFLATLEVHGLLFPVFRVTATSNGWVELEGTTYYLPFINFNSTEVIELPDGTLLNVMVGMLLDKNDHLIPGEFHAFLIASTDKGRSWKFRSLVLNIPDEAKWGVYEPTLTRCKNGTLVCVLRSESGGPVEDPRNLWITTSNDNGFYWSKPHILNNFGVEPELLTLDNNITVVSYGRPGVELRYSYDGNCEKWSKPFVIREDNGIALPPSTCGYTKLFKTAPDRFLIIYSDFKHPDENWNLHKSIKIREIMIRRTGNWKKAAYW